jgi:hypothetical protein
MPFNQDLCDERHDNIDKKLDRILSLVEGNGEPGIRLDVDRLKQRMNLALWVIALFTARMVWLVGQLVYDKVR